MRIPHILPCLVLLLAACTENLETNYITFHVSDEDYLPAPEVATRAVAEAPAVLPLESNLDEDLVLMTTIEDGINLPMQPATRGAQTGTGSAFAFGVSEYASNGTTAVTNFQNVQFSGTSAQPSTAQTVNSGKTWESDAAANAYRFYAYSPTLTTGTASNGLTLQSGNKTITYDCTSVSVTNQKDLMTAYASSTYNSNGVALAFGHRLCAVKIQLAAGWNTNYTIKGVSFSSVVKSGTVSLEDGSWSSLGTAGAYTPAGITETSSASGGVAVYLMMVPQTLSSCVMTVTLEKSGESYQSTLIATLNNNTWGAGQTVTYTISPSAITSVTVTYPASWSPTSGTTTITGPVTTYTTTDSFGLFAVDKDKKIVISNLQITAPTANAASQTITLPSGPLYSQQYTYYIYYPYQSDLITNTTKYNAAGLAAGQTTSATTADTFFANVISGWTVATDQSTANAASYKSSDLQTAKASGTAFTMVHKMGLLTASVPAASTADNVIVYNGNTYNSGASGEKWTRITAECTTVTWNASTTFTSSTNKPYKSGSTLFYMARPGDSSVSISASSGTQLYAWSVSGAATTTGTAGTYKSFTITSPDYTNAFNKKIWKFSYSGTCQQWVAPHAGSYTMECWGAQGGDQSRTNYASGTGSGPTPYGGRGAYVSGQIVLSDQTTLYVYVGEEGGYNNTSTSSTFNGGGYGGDTSWRPGGIDGAGSRGGGATDIRSIKHSGSDGWSGNTSLLSRIIVAAGGGGCTTYGVHGGRTGDGSGGAAGGLIGYSGSITVYGSTSTAGCTPAAGGSQVGGGLGFLYNGSPSYSQSGGLGYGNGSIDFGSDGHRDPGGGSGLYGGGSGGIKGGSPVGSAAGGSSFISGHPGCATITGYTFTSTKMIDGKGLSWTTAGQTTGGSAERMPTTSGGQEALNTGHSGDGYTIITYVKP